MIYYNSNSINILSYPILDIGEVIRNVRGAGKMCEIYRTKTMDRCWYGRYASSGVQL